MFACTTTQETSYADASSTVPVDGFKSYTWSTADTHAHKNPLYDNELVGAVIERYADEQLSKRGLSKTSASPDAIFRYIILLEKKTETTTTPYFSNGGTYAPNANNVSANINSIGYANTYPNVPMSGNFIPPAYGGFEPTNQGPPYNAFYNNQASPYNTTYYINNYPFNNGYGFPIGTGAPNGYGIPNMGTPYTIGGTMQKQTEYMEITLIIDLVDKNTQKLVWRGWTVNKYSDPVTFGEDIEQQVQSIFEKYPQ